MEPYLTADEQKTRRIAFIHCQDEENCGFVVEFKYPNCTFFYCDDRKLGANVDLTTMPAAGYKCGEHGDAERYDLLKEDNICPSCEKHVLAIVSVTVT
jgi:hypothetical protein